MLICQWTLLVLQVFSFLANVYLVGRNASSDGNQDTFVRNLVQAIVNPLVCILLWGAGAFSLIF